MLTLSGLQKWSDIRSMIHETAMEEKIAMLFRRAETTTSSVECEQLVNATSSSVFCLSEYSSMQTELLYCS